MSSASPFQAVILFPEGLWLKFTKRLSGEYLFTLLFCREAIMATLMHVILLIHGLTMKGWESFCLD